MWDWTDRIGVILFDAALSTVVFLTFIVLAMLACRQPARRLLLARVSVLATLAILPLLASGRLPRLDVIDALVESPFFPASLLPAVGRADLHGGDPAAMRAVPGDRIPRRFPRWLAEAAPRATHSLPRALTWVDLACMAVGSAWLLLGIAGVHWLIHRSRLPSPASRALFDSLLAGRSGGVARTGLRVSVRLRHPVVTGLIRPTILIPEAMDCGDGVVEPLRISLLHEIAHAERSDHWFNTAASVAQAIWFFIPHVWWIRSQLLIDQEFLADRSAAEHYGASSEYASALLSLVTAGPAPPPAPSSRKGGSDAMAAGTIGVQSPLSQRMMMLLHCPFPLESGTPRLWSWTSRLAVAATWIAAACLVFRWPQASLAVPAPPAARAAVRCFQVDDFVAKPLHDEASGSERALVHVLPFTLPPRFDLDVEVRCRQSELSHIQIAGYPLGDPPGATTAVPPPSEPGSADATASDESLHWHQVHLHGEDHRVSVVVDGRTIRSHPPVGRPSEWLTIQPPPRLSAEFRRLKVHW